MGKHTITNKQKQYLQHLASGGGSGYLDNYSRVVIAGEVCSQGSWASWLHLVAKGLVAGADGRLTITDLGRQYLKPLQPRSAAEMDALIEDQLGAD